MPSKKSALSKTVQLANRLSDHMRSLNLSPGDSFLSTAEASQFLGVAGGTANRALQLLEKRGVIARRQRLGSVVTEPKPGNGSGFATIYFLFQKYYLQAEGFDYEEVLLGLQEEHPNTAVEPFFLDEGLEERQTVQMIEKSLKSDRPVGIVCVRVPFAILNLIENSGLPSIMFGTRPDGIRNLPSLDRDHGHAIRLAHHFLQTKKCFHVALLMRNHVLGGDVEVLRYFHRIDDMDSSLHFIPPDDRAVEASVRKLLHGGQAPDAMICHTKQFAKKTLDVLRDEGRDARVVLLGSCSRQDLGDVKGLDAVIMDDLEQMQIGRKIGRSLGNQFFSKQHIDETISVHIRTLK